MDIYHKKWHTLRELPDSKHIEISYTNIKNIDLISIVEGGNDQYHVIVTVFNKDYLYNTLETQQEAIQNIKSLIDEIESKE